MHDVNGWWGRGGGGWGGKEGGGRREREEGEEGAEVVYEHGGDAGVCKAGLDALVRCHMQTED